MRCCNIDWLEVFCLEDPIGFPHDADFFRRYNWEVIERDYGTPMYEQMFTLLTTGGERFIEIRRKPKSDVLNKGIFDSYACHVRFSNRSCYYNNAAELMQWFLDEYGFHIQRISRIDICLDFEKFDSGDDPAKFIRRFMSGKYSKINQANIRAFGKDMWDGREWNSLSWGSPTSMITTRLYNKSLELESVKDKPYIRQAWQAAGLVDDYVTMQKKDAQGNYYKPTIWRVEFAIKSGTRGWFVVEDYQGDRKRLQSLRNTLQVYSNRDKIFQVFLSVAARYFHFKKVLYKDGEIMRKDRCEDKELFHLSEIEQFYSIERPFASTQKNNLYDSLIEKLLALKLKSVEQTVWNACDVLIKKLEELRHTQSVLFPHTKGEIELLQRLISERLRNSNISVDDTMKELKGIIEIEKQIWHNPY